MRMPKKKLVFLAKKETDLFSKRRIKSIFIQAKADVRMKKNTCTMLNMVIMMKLAYRIKIAMMILKLK
jgi:hypothetical protein